MSTSLLYHGFGLVGYRYVHTKFGQGRVRFRIEQPRASLRCSACGSLEVWSQGGVDRTFRTVPIGNKPVDLVFKVPRLFCFGCGLTRQAKLSFAEPKKHYTRSFERYALDLSRHMTIEAVATDMSKAYIRAVRENLRGTVHVFDHFHVIKLFNEKLSAFRRSLFHQLVTDAERKVLKGTRWLLLKNPENLDEERNEVERLAEALDLNAPLATAYYLKEDLRQIWQQRSKATARRVLDDWLARARASGIGMLERFATTLEEHAEGILAWYDAPISTGPLEGTNNKIQLMKRQAYGFRDPEFFRLKILGIHETRHVVSRMSPKSIRIVSPCHRSPVCLPDRAATGCKGLSPTSAPPGSTSSSACATSTATLSRSAWDRAASRFSFIPTPSKRR
jgi:transposase